MSEFVAILIEGTGLQPYAEPRPVVWASVYPESQDDFTLLRQSLTARD